MIVVANKMDMPGAEENLDLFQKKYGKKYTVIPTTTIIHEGVDKLIATIAETLLQLPPSEPLTQTPVKLQKEQTEDFYIDILQDNVFEVTGGLVEMLTRKINLDDYDSFGYFQKVLRDRGVISALRKSGAVDGDTVIVGDVEFEFVE